MPLHVAPRKSDGSADFQKRHAPFPLVRFQRASGDLQPLSNLLFREEVFGSGLLLADG
jgi:hypothetical protein